MSNDVKVLRGQLRQLVKELLTEELVKAVDDRVTKLTLDRLDKIEKRQKDIFGFTVRNSAMPLAVKR